jgi:hypothetical protein
MAQAAVRGDVWLTPTLAAPPLPLGAMVSTRDDPWRAARVGAPALAGTGKPELPTAGHRAGCSAGAPTLAPPGSHLYPNTGNGGYTSLHTDVVLVYNATSNRFLPGNHVTLTDRATQCLTSFSLDFERNSVNATDGPDMTVSSIRVNGHPASFKFVQPTYPGDPKGQDDPDPRAHEASQVNPVGGPHHNPLPPACSPELTSTNPAKKASKNGTQCPANKLVIVPSAPIGNGSTFRVTVAYTGRPGVHNDGDGTTEGWFRSDKPKGDGGFVTTEPVGTEDWMPLNDYPSAKPTYDFYDTVNAGKTVLANGILASKQRHPASAQFPHGSVTWHWHSAAPVASYLVEDSVGSFDLTQHTVGGIKFYRAQASSLSAARKAQGKAGGPGTQAGRRAFQRSLVSTFNSIYASKDGFWTVAPSNPTPWGLFSGSSTYARPGIAYIALRQILGPANFNHVLRQVQHQYGGGSITERQWEAAFHHWLPSHSAACQGRLSQFFTQWFDTAYPHGGGAHRPHITGPGLDGPGFYTGACTK